MTSSSSSGLLSTPTEGVIDTFARLDGDLIVLGVAGKMGPTLAWMARRAFDAAGRRDRRVMGVARFTEPATESLAPRPRRRDDPLRPARARCTSSGLPDVPNVVFDVRR